MIELEKFKEEYDAKLAQCRRRIILCAGTSCVANGSLAVRDALIPALEAVNLPVAVELKHEDRPEAGATYISRSGCQGFCQMGPLLHIEPEQILYVRVKPSDVPEIVEKTLLKGEVIERLLYVDPVTGKSCKGDAEIPFYHRQKRVVLANCMIEPGNVAEYIARGGYFGARNAISAMTPAEVCQTVLDSGLRGRGGGGFPTGQKWKFALASPGEEKYVICNGDEGDPGAFMDRSVMEGNPHAVIEGMVIAGKAIGATHGVAYVRAEYPLAVERMNRAVEDAMAAGLLGDNLFDTGFSFHLTVMEGAGAFVCGEETALIASVEGERGTPRPKPPFPAHKGLHAKPTVINNVETLASLPLILREGAEVYRRVGTENSPGTKTFALTGHVANTGLIEVPFGSTLREIVYNIGGGVIDNRGKATGRDFKSVQIGGPSGGCLTPEMLDMPMDFDTLKTVGAMVGSGGLVVMNDQTCIVKIARFFMQFTQNESCGKCTFCRVGTKRMLEILDKIIAGNGEMSDLDQLEDLAKKVKAGSLCGLGQTAPNPVLSTLRYFRKEYEQHVRQKSCVTGECDSMVDIRINPAKCVKCKLCIKKCPVQAISADFIVNNSVCTRCNTCVEICPKKAIARISPRSRG